MDIWIEGLGLLFTGGGWFWALAGMLFGFIIGAIPGLGPVTAVALAIPMTFGFEPVLAMIFLLAVYAGATGGGGVSSILLNIPGTTGSIATCFDGYPMAQNGKARQALGTAIAASAVGALGGAISLAILGPVIASLARLLGPSEITLLIVLAFLLVALGTREDPLKGLLMAVTGLLMSFVGRDIITATARYTGGSVFLEEGIPFVAAVIGIYAFAEVLAFARRGGSVSKTAKLSGSTLDAFKIVAKSPVVVIRSWIVGTGVGIMPGVGINVSGILNWTIQKSTSKDPETYGKGNPRGIVATEVGNNSTATGSLATAFGLGIPGGSTDAILLGGLILYGLTPGSGFFDTSGGNPFFPTMIWGMIIVAPMMMMLVFFMRYIAAISLLPHYVLLPVIVVLSILGAYATRMQMFDVWVMAGMGIVGYFLSKAGFPLHNLVIALVLGELLETNLNRAMRLGDQSPSIFLESPLSIVLVVLGILMLAWVILNPRRILANLRSRRNNDPLQNNTSGPDGTAGPNAGSDASDPEALKQNNEESRKP